jgi:3',5'-cyclic AMP phosphodiesterase CpdA
MANFKLVLLLTVAMISQASCAESPQFSFGLVADIQYADRDPAGETDYRASLRKCEAMVEQFNLEKLTFAVQLGDIIDCHYASYDSIMPIWNRVQAHKYNVPGNHDYVPNEVSSEQVYQRLSLTESYYDFNHGRWRFIVINTNDISLYANDPGSENYIIAEKMLNKLKAQKADGAHPWNGAVGKDQMKWLRGKLQSAQKKGEKVVVFSHHPVTPPALWNADEMIDVIEGYDCVFAFISGHIHEGSFIEKEGISHWVLKSMLSIPQQTSYAIADVYDDRIEIRGIGQEPSMTLRIEKLLNAKNK